MLGAQLFCAVWFKARHWDPWAGHEPLNDGPFWGQGGIGKLGPGEPEVPVCCWTNAGPSGFLGQVHARLGRESGIWLVLEPGECQPR